MLHKSQDEVFVGSKIAEYLIETLLLQLLSLLSRALATSFLLFAFASALALTIICRLQEISVLPVAIVAHPCLDIVHPEVVHVPHFFISE